MTNPMLDYRTTFSPAPTSAGACIAKLNDIIAIRSGCSDYERNLRRNWTLAAGASAEMRELDIRLSVMTYERTGRLW